MNGKFLFLSQFNIKFRKVNQTAVVPLQLVSFSVLYKVIGCETGAVEDLIKVSIYHNY